MPPFLLILAVAAGCGPGRPAGPARPLLDGDHAPDILVERREVARPPATDGSRFLTGWTPWRAGGRIVLSPAAAGGRTRLEVVNLERAARTLVIDFHDGAPVGTPVRVRMAGRDLGAFALTDPLAVPLPFGAAPLGRVAVDLAFGSGDVGVDGAAVRPVLPAGEARIEGTSLVQSGNTIVDLVRPVTGAETLVGTFAPPASPRPGQRFELTVERGEGAPVQRFSWTPGFWERFRGKQRIEIALAGSGGFARVRLRALGAGPAGRWEGLGLTGEGATSPAAPAPLSVTKSTPPPRLVVVYVMDALRADAVGHLGGLPGVSPVIDRLAGEGVTFRAHRSVAPNTLPSTKALFTGRPFVVRGGWKLRPEDGPTLAERFRQAGYHTALFSGNVHVGPSFGTGRGFEHVAEEDSSLPGRPFNDNAVRVHADALAWVRSLPPGSKAFLYLHVLHPHNPYDPPEPYRSRFTAGIPSDIDGSSQSLLAVKAKRIPVRPPIREKLRGLYIGGFAYNDAELGSFLAALAAWAPPAETLFALTADHGEELFDHGGVLHGYTLYEEMLRIPLVLWSPGRLRPGAVTARTDTLDLHATLFDLAGIPRPGEAQGRALASPLPEEPSLAAASSLKGGIYGIRSARFKLIWAPRSGIHWGMGEGIGRSHDPEYFFDLKRDPRETVNLAGDGGLEAAWLRSRLLAWAERGRRSEEEAEQPVDAETLKRLQSLGYANQ
ncbi:MAG TPA: sulfatase [Thermoanaerobaculia bacterium]|nr:sulfatase [Thermoanaerobaculia bacterium]